MLSLDELLLKDRFDARLETDLYLPDLGEKLGAEPVEMERDGLGIWNIIPVNLDDSGYLILGVPKEDQDDFGTSVFYQTAKGLTGELIAAVLLRLLERPTARFMTPEGDMVTPATLTAEPEVEGMAETGKIARLLEF